jgi:hypothetical protein
MINYIAYQATSYQPFKRSAVRLGDRGVIVYRGVGLNGWNETLVTFSFFSYLGRREEL